MSIAKKTKEEIETLAAGGEILATILHKLAEYSKPGVSTEDIDDEAMRLAEEYQVKPVLLGYHPSFAPIPFPAAICTSVNDVVQHGIPDPDIVLEEGDIINIDMSIEYRGLVVDSGLTVPVGKIDKESQRLIDANREALALGIKAAVPGNHIGDIGAAMSKCISDKGFSMVEALCGHGVGYEVHEEPQIPNVGKAGSGPLIEVGHVYAIEPIVNIGSKEVVFDDEGDGYTVYTADGSRSSHFEHTVAITEEGPRILTKRK